MTDENTRPAIGDLFNPDPPSTGWVVHEVYRYNETDAQLWAWCKVQVDAPGYTEIQYTEADGHTASDGPHTGGPRANRVRLGPVLFQVWC